MHDQLHMSAMALVRTVARGLRVLISDVDLMAQCTGTNSYVSGSFSWESSYNTVLVIVVSIV